LIVPAGMAKPRSVYRCTECGHEHPKWVGRCEGLWGVEFRGGGTRLSCRAVGREGGKAATAAPPAVPPSRHPACAISKNRGWSAGPTELPELDFVLGGGIVPGSMTLVGGEPGIGKSTLLLQAAARLEAGGRSVLYASGEESVEQLRLRADRLEEGRRSGSCGG
jgi:DNA repair protein RadA/Sms